MSVDEVDAKETGGDCCRCCCGGEYAAAVAAAAAAAMTWERMWPPSARPFWNRRKQSLQVCLSIANQAKAMEQQRSDAAMLAAASSRSIALLACVLLTCFSCSTLAFG
jgi:hypothetical protein